MIATGYRRGGHQSRGFKSQLEYPEGERRVAIGVRWISVPEIDASWSLK